MNTSNLNATRMLGGNVGTRKVNDFYPTPKFCTEYILDKITFDGPVWEPCCGDGAISECLIDKGYEVKSSDLNDYGYGETGIDFFKLVTPFDNIMTNPPYGDTDKFILHALNLVRKKLVIFHRLNILEGKYRRDNIFNKKRLEEIHVYSERVNFANPEKSGGMVCFAWYVFNKEYKGQPKLYWV